MKALRGRFDFLMFALIIAGFLFVATRGLPTAPLPDTDESMTLQVPYEMLFRGKLAFPMYRYLGGNIENVWHSYTPVFFLMLAGFQKAFGWGLTSGRAFNLVMAAAVLLIIHLTGRRLVDWRAGLAAVFAQISDPTFLDRARQVRNDYPAAMFALLGFYLYQVGEEKGRGWSYVASGLAVGAGVMCHTNALYMLAVMGVLMLLTDGWRIVKKRKPYLFALGAVAAMAYEVVYDVIDRENFYLQNRGDEMHFNVLSRWGWWLNLQREPERYVKWHYGDLKFEAPLALLHAFEALVVLAVIYLIVRLVIAVKNGKLMSEPRVRILVATVAVALFVGVLTQRKVIQYMVHLTPWLALCVGILLRDSWMWFRGLASKPWHRGRLIQRAGVAAACLVVAFYAYALAAQFRTYVKDVTNPERATFEEFKEVLRGVVPPDVCPVAFKSGVLWLAFPEYDRCFASIEARMEQNLDIAGNEYALLARRLSSKEKRIATRITADATLLAELKRTPYGSIYVYYTGANPEYRSRPPQVYYFFGKKRGHISDEMIRAARTVWDADAARLIECPDLGAAVIEAGGLVIQPPASGAPHYSLSGQCAAELMPNMIYQLSLDAASSAGQWELIISDEQTGNQLLRQKITERAEARKLESIFKSHNGGRVKISLRPRARSAAGPLRISRISIREVAPL